MKVLNTTNQDSNQLQNVLDPTNPQDAATKAYVDASNLYAMGYVNHGATSGTSRPSGYAAITWIGSVEPTNATNGDTWIDTT